MKLLTFAVPCYNSQDYMEHCIHTLLEGGDEVEIILVDDGSRDNTGAIADRYAQQYPDIVRVIHQENGGHGEGVNQGLRHAQGLYYKVVDSDDWADVDALRQVVDKLREFSQMPEPVDLWCATMCTSTWRTTPKRSCGIPTCSPRDGCLPGTKSTGSAPPSIC